jgi:hypothetical protein
MDEKQLEVVGNIPALFLLLRHHSSVSQQQCLLLRKHHEQLLKETKLLPEQQTLFREFQHNYEQLVEALELSEAPDYYAHCWLSSPPTANNRFT